MFEDVYITGLCRRHIGALAKSHAEFSCGYRDKGPCGSNFLYEITGHHYSPKEVQRMWSELQNRWSDCRLVDSYFVYRVIDIFKWIFLWHLALSLIAYCNDAKHYSYAFCFFIQKIYAVLLWADYFSYDGIYVKISILIILNNILKILNNTGLPSFDIEYKLFFSKGTLILFPSITRHSWV